MHSPVRKLAISVMPFALVAIASTGALFAQNTSSTPTHTLRNPAPSSGTVGGSLVTGTLSMGITPVRALAGEPFSAEMEQERAQTLADGTHVTQTNQTHLYRDSQGRTRNDLSPGPLPDGSRPVSFVNISDPVEGVRYTLDLNRQIARRHVMPTLGENRPRVEPSPSETTEQAPPARIGRGQMHPANHPANQPANQPADETGRPRTSRVSLGKQTIEGVETVGTQNTITIPVGAEGNDRPIEIVCENWESPELKLMMLSKCTDPLHGDRTTRVVSIDRSEPDPSLFQVPPDFKVEEEETRVVANPEAGTER